MDITNIDSTTDTQEQPTKQPTIRKPSEKSILPDLEKLRIPDDVKNEAERIFQQLELSTKRGYRRKRLVFYCIYSAYKTLGRAHDPKKIAKLVGIKTTEMSKALSMCSPAQTNFQPPSVYHTPKDFIPEYHQMVNLSPSCLDEVLSLCDTISELDPEILEGNPQVVAAGMLMYFMQINGMSVNRKAFAQNVSVSEMTINKMFNQISKIHNS